MGKGFSRCLDALFTLVLLTMALPQKASAYVDPSTGSLLWQMAAAVLVGSVFYGRRLAAWLGNHMGQRSPHPSEPPKDRKDSPTTTGGSYERRR